LVHLLSFIFCLRVVGCGFPMIDLDQTCYDMNYFIQKMYVFINYEDFRIGKSNNYIFMQINDYGFDIINID
jgi:hypothetical protein